MIADEILAMIDGDSPVRDVWMGLHWTAVALTDGRCGMACTLLEPCGEHGHAQVREAGTLHMRSARALSGYAQGGAEVSGLEASVGWAALNALTSDALDEAHCAEMNALDFLLERGAGRRVALVGHFPFANRLRQGVGTLWVLELRPGEGELPASAAPEVFPQADVAAITSMSLVNGTFEELMAHVRSDALVVLLGPSTPLSLALFARGVDVLCGVRVADVEALRRTITQGATFPQVEGLRKVTVVRT
jgi:uncharacterized protein (DUF4213/DUF364 family)